METEMNLTEINELSDYLTTAVYPYYEELREAMLLLSHTGARVAEIFDISRWEFVSDYTVKLQPQKGNNRRTIVLDSRFDDFIDAINGQYKPFIGRTVSQLEYLFAKIKKWNHFRTKGKYFSLYIFRYRYIKQNFADGYTLADIAADMGYTSTHTPTEYLDAILYKSFDVVPVPTVEIGDQIWMVENLAINDGEGGVFYANGDEANVEDFGFVYTWGAAVRVADTVDGWRLPLNADFDDLTSFLGNSQNAGGKLKTPGLEYWDDPNTVNLIDSGFCAVGAGYKRVHNSYAVFKRRGYLWSANESSLTYAACRVLANNSVSFTNTNFDKMRALSVRLIKDS